MSKKRLSDESKNLFLQIIEKGTGSIKFRNDQNDLGFTEKRTKMVKK